MVIDFPKNILKKYNIKPNKYLGQNFLIDKKALKEIIKAADIKPSDTILEIGPGLGVLTKELAKRVHPVKSTEGGAKQFNGAGKIIAIEKDQKMCEILRELLKCWNVGNVEIVNNDILKIGIWKLFEKQPFGESALRPGKLEIENYKVIANLPYYITSPVIRKFLETENKPKLMVLMVQKEVSQRICEKPPHMSVLSVSVQFYAKVKIIRYVSKKSFWPAPKVDSAILRITPINTNTKQIDTNMFFRVVKAGFSHPRKQLAGNFTNMLKLDKGRIVNWLILNKIKPEQRAETLTLNDWINLTKTFKSKF